MRIAKICVDGYGDVCIFIVRSGESLYRRFLLGCADGWHGAGGVRYKGRDGSRWVPCRDRTFPVVRSGRSGRAEPDAVANGFRHRFENRPLRVHFGRVGRQPEGQLLGRLHLSRAETFSWNRPPLPPCGDVRNGTNGSDYSDREGFFRTRRSGVASAVGASVSVSAGERKRRLVGLYG